MSGVWSRICSASPPFSASMHGEAEFQQHAGAPPGAPAGIVFDQQGQPLVGARPTSRPGTVAGCSSLQARRPAATATPSCPTQRAAHPGRAARLLDEAIAPSPCPARCRALRLGREEGLEHPRQRVRVHAAAVVVDFDAHIVAGSTCSAAGRAASSACADACTLIGPPAGMRVASVEDQVEQRVLQLVGVDPGPQRRRRRHRRRAAACSGSERRTRRPTAATSGAMSAACGFERLLRAKRQQRP